MLGGVPNWLDLIYLLGVGVSSPYWLLVGKARAKVLGAFRERVPPPAPSSPLPPPGGVAAGSGKGGVLIHAVSLGEINATRTLVSELRARRPGLRVTVSATTTTGYARATELYGGEGGVAVDRYPLDVSWAVRRFLDRHRPGVVVLMELELWPNFLRECERRGIEVVLVNGRLTAHSLRHYRWIGPVARGMFRRVGVLCVQDETYRRRFVEAGAPAERVVVTGSMKFDTAQLAVEGAKVEALRREVGLVGGGKVWVCGSTGPGEEREILGVYRRLRGEVAGLRLVLVPRKPERFEEVAGLIGEMGFEVVRRSAKAPGREDAVVLGDTVGELRTFYALADVIFVGRSLVDLGPKQHGSDMLEAAALGKAVVVGPFTGNFADAMEQLRRGGGVVEVADGSGLEREVGRLLRDAGAAGALGEAARRLVEGGRGATSRHADVILRRVSGEGA